MRNILKGKVALILVLISFFILLDLLIGLEGKCKVWPYIDTKFARNFSVNKFNGISHGMNYHEVKLILGEPLFFSDERLTSVQPKNAIFISVYSIDGRCEWADFAWKSFDIYFDKDTLVIGKHSQWWYD
jgi:hypothetical protein